MISRYPWLLAAALLMINSSQAGGPVEDGLEYALAQDGCGFDHGYVCLDRVEDDFLSLESHDRMVPGNYMKAWQIAAADFAGIPDLEDEQRNYKHYKFGFTENQEHYIVLFQALLLPAMEDGQAIGPSRGTYGRTTRYWINKKTLTIDNRLFYKS